MDMLEKVAAGVEETAKMMESKGMPALDVAMMRKLMTPFAQLLEVHRAAETRPAEFGSSTAWIVGVMLAEFIANTNEHGADPDAVINQINELIAEILQTALGSAGETFGFRAQVSTSKALAVDKKTH